MHCTCIPFTGFGSVCSLLVLPPAVGRWWVSQPSADRRARDRPGPLCSAWPALDKTSFDAHRRVCHWSAFCRVACVCGNTNRSHPSANCEVGCQEGHCSCVRQQHQALLYVQQHRGWGIALTLQQRVWVGLVLLAHDQWREVLCDHRSREGRLLC